MTFSPRRHGGHGEANGVRLFVAKSDNRQDWISIVMPFLVSVSLLGVYFCHPLSIPSWYDTVTLIVAAVPMCISLRRLWAIMHRPKS